MKYPAFLLDLSSGSARTVEDESERVGSLFPVTAHTDCGMAVHGKSSLLKQLREPRETLLEESNRFRILLQAGNRMNSDSATAARVIATGSSADGDDPKGGSTYGDTSKGAAAQRD